jgi:hypothetical protein
MPDSRHTAGNVNRFWIWVGAVFLLIGFLGHFFAARAIGGTYVAYRDHILGFFLILIVTGALIALLGRWFWKARPHITLLIVGATQALFGIVVYLQRFHVHG